MDEALTRAIGEHLGDFTELIFNEDEDWFTLYQKNRPKIAKFITSLLKQHKVEELTHEDFFELLQVFKKLYILDDTFFDNFYFYGLVTDLFQTPETEVGERLAIVDSCVKPRKTFTSQIRKFLSGYFVYIMKQHGSSVNMCNEIACELFDLSKHEPRKYYRLLSDEENRDFLESLDVLLCGLLFLVAYVRGKTGYYFFRNLYPRVKKSTRSKQYFRRYLVVPYIAFLKHLEAILPKDMSEHKSISVCKANSKTNYKTRLFTSEKHVLMLIGLYISKLRQD